MEENKITYLEQSGFIIQTGSSTLLIDPSKKKYGDRPGNVVIVTHHHYDHTGGVTSFLKRNPEAIFICNKQVAERFDEWRDQIVLAVPGEELQHKMWSFSFIEGRHGIFSKVLNTGMIIKTPSLSFGHAGDTVEFQGFIGKKMDFFAIPIGGMFTASPKRAIKELTNFSKPLPIVIPMHWLWRSPRRFCKRFSSIFPESRCVIPENGELIDLSTEES